jgi:uncharacterized membrane protein YkoI
LEDDFSDLTGEELEIEDEGVPSPSETTQDEEIKSISDKFEKETSDLVGNENTNTSKGENGFKLGNMKEVGNPNSDETETGDLIDEVEVSPSQVMDAVKSQVGQTKIGKVELGNNSQGRKVFKVSGKRNGNLFGFLPIESEFETEVDAQSGQVLDTVQTGWWKNLERFVL